ncbi:helix-turn-helix domain-containing protein [Actinomadura alba]|uniref:Helix-turn-helix transcriptional regulator n=1 Tax=Actinomadura alba TaxID=406431 RepID=A0ABR7LTM1_9ACTN|nr:helix-turn-helix transcriptional regulator [Actinomadura alba]MBC6467743.1 helix-turn-helix transcriptional regulator [Actinomadura alba]
MTSPFVRRRRLATELRTLREEKGMTAGRLSQLLHQSRMKVSRLENAHIRPDLAEIMKILDLLGVTGDKWNEVVRVARDAAERGWWDSFGEAMGPRQRLYADLESGASAIQEYNQAAIPGVLQTPDFTWGLVELDRAEGPLRYVPERMAQARLQRQRAVLRQDGPTYDIVLDEVVVRRLTVPAAVLRAQLHHLIEVVSAEPGVTVQVLPLDARVEGGLLPKSTFALYTFPDPEDPRLAVVDTAVTDLVHTDPCELARYTGHYERLRKSSLSPADSLALLGKIAEELTDQAGPQS